MSDQASEFGHKRSESSIARSILHHDRSKSRELGGVSSPHASPSASKARLLSHSRSTQQLRDANDAANRNMTSLTGGGMEASSPAEAAAAIEQSVRVFRLFETLRGGDSAIVAKVIRDTAEEPSHAQVEGTSILHLAIQCAEPPVVEQILSAAAANLAANIDINAQDRDGNTPLHLASMLGRVSLVRLLLAQQTADGSILNYQGRSALELTRSSEIFQLLQVDRALFAESKVQAVHEYVLRRDYDGLERLLEDLRIQAVLDINGGELASDPSTIESGGTLLHQAAKNKDLKLIQLLLLNGADPFRRDRKGKLPQDITKDDKTKAILKKSPAAAAAQRGIQEKAIVGSHASDRSAGKESREMKGYLKKWTNYTSGYKLRWFVLEDGVLSYYKNQDDAGSACRGAMNMRIAILSMDAQDRTRFEIQGKSSVKYHLKANHAVEAKRWFWALNNAIQWAKDEAKEEESRKHQDAENARQARNEQKARGNQSAPSTDTTGRAERIKSSGKGLIPATSIGASSASISRVPSRPPTAGPSNTIGDDHGGTHGPYDPGDLNRVASAPNTATIAGDLDDDEEYGDDASSREVRVKPKDAFNITAHSAHLQLNLLSQVSSALEAQASAKPDTPISNPAVAQAMATYEGAVRSLQAMVGDLLRISRDRDAYWQYRVDRETDMRRLWEDSMAMVAKEQELLEGRIGESEEKRKRTKRALREALEDTAQSRSDSRGASMSPSDLAEALDQVNLGGKSPEIPSRKVLPGRDARRKSTIATLTDLSDSDSDADEEFFDAVGAGTVEIVDVMPTAPSRHTSMVASQAGAGHAELAMAKFASSFKGYEDSVRKRLAMDADDRPKISLWGILKSMIGKDMTKMTLPVSFNEPTSLLQRVAEDMEYTDLLDTAARRDDSTERMVYIAAFAASEYASTVGRVAKPFNPLLAETYEYARPDKGYRFFIEQVSHHPTIGAAWAESPRWDYYGESAVTSKFYGKSFDINPLGTWFLKLRPATGGEELYTWKKVTSSVIGIITGSPTVDNHGLMEIKNWTTGDVCMLDFKARGWKASSAFQVSGKVVAADGKTRWSMGGHWNDKIYARLTPGFEGTVTPPPGQPRAYEPGSPQAFLVWEAHQRPPAIPFNLTPFVVTLNALPDRLRPFLPPTDTRLRPDQRAMEDGEYDLAATEKNRLEEKQRAARRVREATGEEFVPRWFRRETCGTTGEEYWRSNGEYWQNRESVAAGGEWERVADIF